MTQLLPHGQIVADALSLSVRLENTQSSKDTAVQRTRITHQKEQMKNFGKQRTPRKEVTGHLKPRICGEVDLTAVQTAIYYQSLQGYLLDQLADS